MIQYSKIKTLLIEDYADYASAIISMLHAMGCNQVDHVSSADSAIQKCRETSYDLILSDYNLGDNKDGQQVFEELRHFKLIPEDTCFIMITAEKNVAMVMAALESRPDSYLAKPFSRQLLKSRIDKSLTKRAIFKPINTAVKKKDWVKVEYLYQNLLKDTNRYTQDLKRIKLIILKNTVKPESCQKYLEDEINERATPWALKELGSLFYSIKQYTNSENIFKKMLLEFPSAIDGYDWLAKIQDKTNRPVEAQQTIERAISRSPKVLKRQRTLARFAEQNGDDKTMLNAYRQTVKQGKHSVFSHPDEYVKLTKSLALNLKTIRNERRDKLIKEANNTFQQLQSKFSDSSSIKFRGAVAHADFNVVIDDKRGVEKQIGIASKLFDQIDENIGAKECIEIATSLQYAGFSELAENVLEDGVEQYFDNLVFLNQVKKITNNKNLISNANKVNKINTLAVKYFKSKQYDRSLKEFKLALSIAPNNINIALNRAQALLKKYQQKKQDHDLLMQAESILSDIERLTSDDVRYVRYLELMRLSQIMLQSADI